MMRFIQIFLLTILVGIGTSPAFAGNPDRQGEAGAPQLNMIPWAAMAGLHGMNTSTTSGVEAMRLNVAGVVRISKTEFVGSHGIYLQGTGITTNAFGFAQRIGKSGAFGVTVMALDFGDIAVTTTDQPGGTGATFNPRFFNIGLGYAHMFENKISVGVAFRAVSEAISNLGASGFAIDAGIQYVTGTNDNFRFGISLRNIGGRLKYSGEGLSTPIQVPLGSGSYALAGENRPSSFEIQSMLNIGLSYDFILSSKTKFTVLGNFTSNAFSQDQIGGGAEFSFNEILKIRGGYRYDLGATALSVQEAPLYTGPSAGASIELPLNREKKDGSRLGIDYAFRATKLFGGTHNIGVRLSL